MKNEFSRMFVAHDKSLKMREMGEVALQAIVIVIISGFRNVEFQSFSENYFYEKQGITHDDFVEGGDVDGVGHEGDASGRGEAPSRAEAENFDSATAAIGLTGIQSTSR